MATDELTEGELFDAIFHNHWPLIQKHDAALRADRDRLREERDQLLGEAIKRTADRHDDVAGRTRANASEAIENLVRQVAKLREEIAAKDAEIQRWKNMSVSEFGQLKQQCAPMEDWRGANDDWRKR